jgi:hypothetical protein
MLGVLFRLPRYKKALDLLQKQQPEPRRV